MVTDVNAEDGETKVSVFESMLTPKLHFHILQRPEGLNFMFMLIPDICI